MYYDKHNPEIFPTTDINWTEKRYHVQDIFKKISSMENLKDSYIEKNLEVRSFFPFRDVTFLLGIDKLIEDGLYEPKIGINEGLQKTFKWYLEEKPILRDKRMVEIESLLKGE